MKPQLEIYLFILFLEITVSASSEGHRVLLFGRVIISWL